jgi:hypothetical protein
MNLPSVSLKTIRDAVTYLDEASEVESLIAKNGGSRTLLTRSWLASHRDNVTNENNLQTLGEIGCFISFTLACNLRLLIMAFHGSSISFDTLYRVFKNSDGRELSLPTPILGSIQSELKQTLPSILRVHDCAHAYLRKRNQFTNATPHVGKEVVATIDIKSFFPSITTAMIASTFKAGPLSQMSEESISLLSGLCSRVGRLPVGVSTSPYIANAVMYDIDRQISGLSKSLGVNYTRFADDLTFSGTEYSVRNLMQVATGLLQQTGFQLNDSKTRIMRATQRQIVTGVVVNVRLSAPRKDRRQLRAMYHGSRCGRPVFDGHREISDSSLCAKLGHVGKLHPNWVVDLKNKQYPKG